MSTRQKPVPHCAQRHDYDCGTACLAMVARYHGTDASADSLASACEPDFGISIPDLIGLAHALGLQTRRVSPDRPLTDLETAIQAGTPPIVVVNPRWVYGVPLEVPHYVVIIALDDDSAVIHDPDVGPNVRVPPSAILAGLADTSFRGVIAWK